MPKPRKETDQSPSSKSALHTNSQKTKSAFPEEKQPKNDFTLKKRKKTPRTKEQKLKTILISFLVVASVIVLIIAAWNLILDHFLNKLNKVTGNDPGLVYATEELGHTNTEDEQALWDIIKHEGIGEVNGIPLICDTKNVLNILLIGSDARNKTSYSLSDTMILVSINTETRKILMCSFLRDILVSIDEHSPNRINTAYAFGGPELLIKTLKNNFNIEVQHYMSVNFFDFVDIVDTMGGLDVYASADEIEVMNYYLLEINELYERPFGTDNLPLVADTYHMNGKQALGFARNRYTGNGDFSRTQRQRYLISLMVDKVKTMNLSQMNSLLNTVLPMITTNMTNTLLKSLINNLPTYLGYDLVTTNIPQQDMFRYDDYSGMDIIIIDAPLNVRYLYELIYGTPAPREMTEKEDNPVETTEAAS